MRRQRLRTVPDACDALHQRAVLSDADTHTLARSRPSGTESDWRSRLCVKWWL